MGRKRIPEEQKKVKISVSLSRFLVDWLYTHENHSAIIEKELLKIYKKEEK